MTIDNSLLVLFVSVCNLLRLILLSCLVDPESDDFRLNNITDDGKYGVIMCLKTEPVLSVHFTMIDRHQPKNSKTERLCQEGNNIIYSVYKNSFGRLIINPSTR